MQGLRFIGNLLRVYSYLFEAILSLMSLAMSAVLFASPHQTLRLGWLPWAEESLGAWLAGMGVLGLLLVVLAAAGRLRILLTLFALAALVLLTRGLFLSGWRFSGEAELKNALWLVGGAFVAVLGSIPMRGDSGRGYGR
jgi:hypothetical protein